MSKTNQPTSTEYLFLLLQFDSESRLGPETFMLVLSELDKVSSGAENTRIDLVIHSVGGDVHHAYRIINSIRARCSACQTVIPLLAKSAATLMALGGDEIVMGPDSELGPLDVQMEHPLMEGMRISGLDGVKPVEILTQMASNLAFDIGLRLRTEIYLGRRDSIEIALDYVARCIKPVLEKLDPAVVALCYRELDVAGKYGRELLTRFMLKDHPSSKDLAKRIIEKLVWTYPSHSYAVRRGGAKALDLLVLNAEDYRHWEVIGKIFWELAPRGKDVICLIMPDKLQSLIEPEAGEDEARAAKESENAKQQSAQEPE